MARKDDDSFCHFRRILGKSLHIADLLGGSPKTETGGRRAARQEEQGSVPQKSNFTPCASGSCAE
jgi:hypothetical protein